MDKDTAFRKMDELEQSVLKEVPEDFGKEREEIRGFFLGARQYLEDVYEQGLSVGANFSAMPQYLGDHKGKKDYDFYIKGITRHINIARDVASNAGIAFRRRIRLNGNSVLKT